MTTSQTKKKNRPGTNIHRKNEVTNNRQQLLADGFSFYAVAEISTTKKKRTDHSIYPSQSIRGRCRRLSFCKNLSWTNIHKRGFCLIAKWKKRT